MSTIRTQILEALASLCHPDSGENIVEMGMVQRVTVNGSQARVELVPVAENMAFPPDFLRRVREVAGSVPGISAVEDRLRGPDLLTPEGGTRIIGIVSGKGGVGKSTVTAHLAVALHRRGRSVAVLDADIYGYSIPQMLGTSRKPAVVGGRVIPANVRGIKVMSMGLIVPDNKPVILRGPLLHKSFEQFLTEVAWADPEFLLVDLPPGTGDLALSFMQSVQSAEILLVTTPQTTAHTVAVRAGWMAQEVNTPVLGVVENMSFVPCPQCALPIRLFKGNGGEEVARALGVPLLGRVPLDPDVAGADEPVAIRDDSPLSSIFDPIAAHIEQNQSRIWLPMAGG